MVKNSPARAEDGRDMGSIPGLERSPEGGNGNPFHGQRSLVGYSPWGRIESNRTERCHAE